MDSLLEAIGKLLGVFKDPAMVLLLLVACGEGFALYKLAQFFLNRYDKDIESRATLASALNNLSEAVKENDK